MGPGAVATPVPLRARPLLSLARPRDSSACLSGPARFPRLSMCLPVAQFLSLALDCVQPCGETRLSLSVPLWVALWATPVSAAWACGDGRAGDPRASAMSRGCVPKLQVAGVSPPAGLAPAVLLQLPAVPWPWAPPVPSLSSDCC